MPADETIAESSTAPTEAVENVPLESLNDAQYAEWRKSGTLPTKVAAPAAEPDAEEEGEEPEADAEPSESEPEPKKPSRGADKRIQELLKDRKELKERLEALERKQSPAKEEPKAEPAAELQPPVKPKAADFSDWEKYQDARDKYFEDLAEFKKQEARAEIKAEALKAEQDKEAKKADEDINGKFRERVQASIKKHADYADVAFQDSIQLSPVMDRFVHPDPVA